MFDVADLLPPGQVEQITVTATSQAALLTDLEQRLDRREAFSLATLNLDHIVKIIRDPAFRAAYARQSIVTADGNPVVWLCRLAGQDVSLVPGADLVDPLAALCARLGLGVALVGSTETSLQVASETLTARYPGLQVVLQIAPSMQFDPEGAEARMAIARIIESDCALVFLALGAPKQEIFAAYAQTQVKAGLVSIGAGLDFISGAQSRAPRLFRFFAAEWLWRLLRNPRRFLARYGACFAVLPRAGLAALRARRGSL